MNLVIIEGIGGKLFKIFDRGLWQSQPPGPDRVNLDYHYVAKKKNQVILTLVNLTSFPSHNQKGILKSHREIEALQNRKYLKTQLEWFLSCYIFYKQLGCLTLSLSFWPNNLAFSKNICLTIYMSVPNESLHHGKQFNTVFERGRVEVMHFINQNLAIPRLR